MLFIMRLTPTKTIIFTIIFTTGTAWCWLFPYWREFKEKNRRKFLPSSFKTRLFMLPSKHGRPLAVGRCKCSPARIAKGGRESLRGTTGGRKYRHSERARERVSARLWCRGIGMQFGQGRSLLLLVLPRYRLISWHGLHQATISLRGRTRARGCKRTVEPLTFRRQQSMRRSRS